MSGEMGAELAGELGLPCRIVHQPAAAATTAADTRIAAERMREAGVDLLLFAGGDGTARDICLAYPKKSSARMGGAAGLVEWGTKVRTVCWRDG